MKPRTELCPYVNGISENIAQKTISGHCYIIPKKCFEIRDYEDCNAYLGIKDKHLSSS